MRRSVHRVRWGVIAALLAGAGCSDASPGDFVGSWQYASGTATVTCDGQTGTEPKTGTVTIELSDLPNTDLIANGIDDGLGCPAYLSVDGDAAVLREGGCNQNGPPTWDETFESASVSLTGDNTAHVSSHVTVTNYISGMGVSCGVAIRKQ